MTESNALQQANSWTSSPERQNKARKARHRKSAQERLAETMLAMPAPPCTHPVRCPHIKHCAVTGDACIAFMLYAVQKDSDGVARIPKRKLGKRLWNRKELFPQSIDNVLTNTKEAANLML